MNTPVEQTIAKLREGINHNVKIKLSRQYTRDEKLTATDWRAYFGKYPTPMVYLEKDGVLISNETVIGYISDVEFYEGGFDYVLNPIQEEFFDEDHFLDTGHIEPVTMDLVRNGLVVQRNILAFEFVRFGS